MGCFAKNANHIGKIGAITFTTEDRHMYVDLDIGSCRATRVELVKPKKKVEKPKKKVEKFGIKVYSERGDPDFDYVIDRLIDIAEKINELSDVINKLSPAKNRGEEIQKR